MNAPGDPPPSEPAAQPEVQEGFLEADGVARWKRDLDACAEVLDVRVKMRGRVMSDDEQMDLAKGLEALTGGAAGAMQVRYRFEGDVWCDTVMPHGDGVRLIRTRMPVQS